MLEKATSSPAQLVDLTEHDDRDKNEAVLEPPREDREDREARAGRTAERAQREAERSQRPTSPVREHADRLHAEAVEAVSRGGHAVKNRRPAKAHNREPLPRVPLRLPDADIMLRRVLGEGPGGRAAARLQNVLINDRHCFECYGYDTRGPTPIPHAPLRAKACILILRNSRMGNNIPQFNSAGTM